MVVYHICMFKFKTGVLTVKVSEVMKQVEKLKQACTDVHGKQYIISIESGYDVSIENRAKGYTHAFIATFKDTEARNYYIHDDQEHIKFTNMVSQYLDDVLVFDFEH